MCKLAHVIRYTILSQNFHFCCFRANERWLTYDCETQFCLFNYAYWWPPEWCKYGIQL